MRTHHGRKVDVNRGSRVLFYINCNCNWQIKRITELRHGFECKYSVQV